MVGLAILLTNLGVVTINWQAVLSYWPVLLILFGLDFLLGRSLLGSIAVALIGFAVVAGVIFWAGTQDVPSTSKGVVTEEFSPQALSDIRELEVVLEIGAAETTVSALPGSSDYAFDGSYTAEDSLRVETDYRVRGSRGILGISQEGRHVGSLTTSFVSKLDLRLTPSVPVDMVVNAGAGRVILDLSGVNLRSLSIDAGVGEMVITLPETGDYSVEINAGVGNLEIIIPETIAGQVNYEGALTTLNISSRFEKTGDNRWQTAGYARASDRATISLEAAVGSINIHE